MTFDLHSLKLSAKAPENRPKPKRKRESLPSIHFQGAFAVSFGEGKVEGVEERTFFFNRKKKQMRKPIYN